MADKNIQFFQNKGIMTVPPVSHIVVYEGGDIISDGGGDCEDKEPHQVTIAVVTMRQCDDCGADPQIGGATVALGIVI